MLENYPYLCQQCTINNNITFKYLPRHHPPGPFTTQHLYTGIKWLYSLFGRSTDTINIHFCRYCRWISWISVCTVYPKKYAHGFCFAVLCCGYTLTDFPISIRLTSLALWQSNDCPSASKSTLMNMDKYFIMNDCITTTKQSTTKPCAYFLGYTVHYHNLHFHFQTVV